MMESRKSVEDASVVMVISEAVLKQDINESKL